MSFEIIRDYRRAVLLPIAAVTEQAGRSGADEIAGRHPTPTTSPYWTATTHTFQGTRGRFISSAWPLDRFSEDPSNIPDDKTHNIEYDARSAQIRSQDGEQGKYHLFGEPSGHKSVSARLAVPRVAVKRYIPRVDANGTSAESGRRLTLLLLPGMGLPKEVFEPMIDGIIAKQRDAGFSVAELWSVDMPMCGETALANPVGYLYANEKDIARDLMLFVTTYLPLDPGDDLPFELRPRRIDNNRRQPTRQDLHVVGHSLGAQSAMLIASHAPDLFQSLTVFDPAIIPSGKIQQAFTKFPKDVLCTGIKYKHKSREALMAAINANKRTQGWEQRVKEIFVSQAAVGMEDGTLRLTSHPRLEWALYYDQETPSHCYDRLADIRVPLNAIMPSRPFAIPAKMFEADLAKLPQRTQLTWISKSTHQLPFERVDECTALVVSWLQRVAGQSLAKL